MKVCPHCGGELGTNARFCARCMTVLNQRQVVPTPKYFPLRWLSAAAAVLVLCGAVWSGLQWQPQEEQDAIAPPVTTASATSTSTAATTTKTTTDAPTTTLTAVASTTLTTLAKTFSTTMESSTTATKKPISYPTYATIPTAPKTTTGTTASRTTAASTSTSTTTKKATTTTTAATPTYPASWDEPAVFYTEDGEVFEDVGWTYRAAGDSLRLANGGFGEYNTFTKSYLYNVPMSQCIIITGFTNPAANGCYRIPPTIDGKVVVGVDMQQPVDGACQFNDEGVAPTVRIITFPPEMIVVYPYTFHQCQNMEHAYFTSARLMMYPSAVPTDTGHTYSNSLAMHAYRTYMLYDPYGLDYSWLKQYCQYIVDPGVCITNGNRMHYTNVYWWPTNTDFFAQLYPDWFTYKHNEG